MPENQLYDFLSAFIGGVDSGIHPLVLPKDKLAFGLNTTCRGGFPHPRPVMIRHTLDFGSDSALQNLVEKSFFQGAGYYRPDFGPSSMVAQIGGRLFEFTDNGDRWAVGDVTVPGDPNDASTNQVWMNQAEKWLIVSDGSAKNLIFFDGVTSRRSFGPSQSLGTAIAFDPANPPPQGSTVEVTLNAPYTGPFDIPVLFNGAFYQPIQNSVVDGVITYPATIKNPGNVSPFDIPAGTDVVVPPSNSNGADVISLSGSLASQTLVSGSGMTSNQVWSGFLTGGNFSSLYSLPTTAEITVQLSAPYLNPPGENIYFIGGIFTQSITIQGEGVATPSTGQNTMLVKSVSNGGMTIVVSPTVDLRSLGIGTALNVNGIPKTITAIDPMTLQPPGQRAYFNTSSPSFIVGQLATAATIPQNTSGTVIQLTQPYTGPDDQVVTIGGASYTISKTPPATPSVTLTLINLTDADQANPYVNPEPIVSVPELPPGRMGAYGQSHQAMSLVDGISFIYGDTLGGPSGTPANNYRDAVLKNTENTFIQQQGAFRIPNSGEVITSMTFTAVLDNALGQGPLQLGTSISMFSCLVPTVRAVWATMTSPILPQSLIGKGPLAQDSTKLANSDTLFRSFDGMGSLILARRDITDSWGNTPISREMERIFKLDNQALLIYGSLANFDNRALMTASPQAGPQGVFHVGQCAINYDPVSNLNGKSPPIWDGVWTGINVLKWVTGLFSGVERCFAFVWSFNESKIELWELLREGVDNYQDNNETPIIWAFETGALFRPTDRDKNVPAVKLHNGKLHISDLKGTATINVYFRPDFSPCWILWHSRTVCADHDSDPNSQPGYYSPIGLGEPPDLCGGATNQQFRIGRFFQLRFECQGSFVFRGAEFAAVPEPVIEFPPPVCDNATVTQMEFDSTIIQTNIVQVPGPRGPRGPAGNQGPPGANNISGLGSPIGVRTPDAINQIYRDTTPDAEGLYQATGLTNMDWYHWI